MFDIVNTKNIRYKRFEYCEPDGAIGNVVNDANLYVTL